MIDSFIPFLNEEHKFILLLNEITEKYKKSLSLKENSKINQELEYWAVNK